MEIIIISGLDKRVTLSLTPLHVGVGLLTSFIVITALFHYGTQYAAGMTLKQVLLAYEREVSEQRELVSTSRLQAQQQLEVLSARLSNLQNQLVRLNTLGKQVTKIAGLDGFDFELNPGKKDAPVKKLNQRYATVTVNDFVSDLDHLSRLSEDRREQLLAMQSVLTRENLFRQLSPGGRPVVGSFISSLFGLRKDPFTDGKKVFHEGLDLVSDAGTPVISSAAGVVTWSGERYGYGNTIEIRHGYGYVTRYAHNEKNLVDTGDVIEKGQPIALLGASGRATGPHLHYEVLFNGVHVDPKEYLRMN